jgi:hypothetical protein
MSTSPRSPLLTFATFGHPLTGLKSLSETAWRARLPTLDLEVNGRVGRAEPSSVTRAIEELHVGLNALWVDRQFARLIAGHLEPTLAKRLTEIATLTGAAAVVCSAAIGDGTAAEGSARLARRLRASLSPATRLTLALRPHHLEATRAHLDRLATMRRLAEEWDHDLALDLCGPIDPAWESEAALSKVLPRLTIVRIGPLESRPPGRSRVRQTQRVLAYLADQGYGRTIAIAATAPPWPIGRKEALARSLDRTADAIVARFTTVHHERWLDSIRETNPLL